MEGVAGCVPKGFFLMSESVMSESSASRREFLVAAVAVGSAAAGVAVAETSVERPLFAYIGTFSSPLKDVLPTQVDLPPGNGRGIHICNYHSRVCTLCN